MEEKRIYCILCGQENTAEAKTCTGCGQLMEQKDENQVKTFAGKKVKEGIKDKVKEEAGNIFTSWLSKLVNSQLYGLLLSFSIIASAGTVMAAGNEIHEFTGELPVETSYGQQALYSNTVETLAMGLHIKEDYGSGDTFIRRCIEGRTDYASETEMIIRDGSGAVAAVFTGGYAEQTPVYFEVSGSCSVETVSVGHYDGRENRTIADFGEDGRLLRYQEFRDDVLIIDRTYYPNGRVEKETAHTVYSENDLEYLEDYTVSWFDENGTRIKKEYYKNGDLLKTEEN